MATTSSSITPRNTACRGSTAAPTSPLPWLIPTPLPSSSHLPPILCSSLQPQQCTRGLMLARAPLPTCCRRLRHPWSDAGWKHCFRWPPMSCAAFFQLTLVTFHYNDCVLLRGGWGGWGGGLGRCLRSCAHQQMPLCQFLPQPIIIHFIESSHLVRMIVSRGSGRCEGAAALSAPCQSWRRRWRTSRRNYHELAVRQAAGVPDAPCGLVAQPYKIKSIGSTPF
jgi:hypothetical protein